MIPTHRNTENIIRMKNLDKLRLQSLFFLAVIITFSSCISQKNTVYLQNKSTFSDGSGSYENDLAVYKVQAGDFLYINVTSMDPSNISAFAMDNRTEYQLQSDMGVYLKSYQVNDSGYVNIPIVGKVNVVGLSINQVRNKLQKELDEFYKLTTVTVKLVNFKISIMGEVNRPGTYTVYQDKLNIFQAISMGGDLTSYANRKEVNIIRKSKTGGTEVLKVNLLTDSLLELPGFYLHPEDIIYVEPLRSKSFAFTSFPYAIALSTITTTLLILNFFK